MEPVDIPDELGVRKEGTRTRGCCPFYPGELLEADLLACQPLPLGINKPISLEESFDVA